MNPVSMSLRRNSWTADSSSASLTSSMGTLKSIFLLPLFFSEWVMNLEEALIAFFFNVPILVDLSSEFSPPSTTTTPAPSSNPISHHILSIKLTMKLNKNWEIKTVIRAHSTWHFRFEFLRLLNEKTKQSAFINRQELMILMMQKRKNEIIILW